MNEFNISTIRNDTYPGLSATIIKNGSPLDLTGSVIRMMLKKTAGDTCYQLEFSSLSTTENVITIFDPPAGKFRIEPEIITLQPKVYVYDVQVHLSDNTVITFLKGNFEVLIDITT